MTVTRILAIRHAATAWNADKRLQGRTDIPLSPAGIDSLTGRVLPAPFLTAPWYCSPLRRARQTAALLGIEAPTLVPALIETHWGDWEGERLPELRRRLGERMRQLEALGLDLQPPAGESPRQVRARVMAWLHGEAHPARIGLVTHKGVLRALLSEALDWDLKRDCPVKVDWQRALLFRLDAGRLQLETYNLDLSR